MNAACGWTLIRKTSLLRKINPMMRRSSFTNKDIYQLAHLAMNERRNVPEIVIAICELLSQIPNSDQSPLYDVRNPAGASCKGRRMRSDVFADDVFGDHSQPVFALSSFSAAAFSTMRFAEP